MNGWSFGAVSLTAGRYGYVVIDATSACYLSHAETLDRFARSIDLLVHTRGRSRERDSITCHYGRYKPNQLSSKCRVLRLSLTWALTVCNIELLMLFSSVSTIAYAFPLPKEKAYDAAAFLSDNFPPVCDCRFAIDYSSHVRLYLQLQVKTSFRNQALIDTTSFAIWNKNKVVVMLAVVVWGIGIVSHIQSKALPITSCTYFESEFHTTVVWSTDATQVNAQLFKNLDKLGLSHP